MDMADILSSFQFYSLTNPSPLRAFWWYPYGIWSLFALSFILFLVYLFGSMRFEEKSPKRILLTKFVSGFMWALGLGGVLLFARRIGIAYLAAPIWIVSWVICVISFLAYIWGEYRHHLPGELQTYEQEKLRKKYLPRKRR